MAPPASCSDLRARDAAMFQKKQLIYIWTIVGLVSFGIFCCVLTVVIRSCRHERRTSEQRHLEAGTSGRHLQMTEMEMRTMAKLENQRLATGRVPSAPAIARTVPVQPQVPYPRAVSVQPPAQYPRTVPVQPQAKITRKPVPVQHQVRNARTGPVQPPAPHTRAGYGQPPAQNARTGSIQPPARATNPGPFIPQAPIPRLSSPTNLFEKRTARLPGTESISPRSSVPHPTPPGPSSPTPPVQPDSLPHFPGPRASLPPLPPSPGPPPSRPLPPVPPFQGDQHGQQRFMAYGQRMSLDKPHGHAHEYYHGF